MDDNLVGVFRPGHGTPGMAGLATGLLAGTLTQRMRLGWTFFKSIGRRRAIGVRAVCSELGFQLRYRRTQIRDHRLQLHNHCLLLRKGRAQFFNDCLLRKDQRIFFIASQAA